MSKVTGADLRAGAAREHTQRIHAKLGTRDRAQAVAAAYAAVRTSAYAPV